MTKKEEEELKFIKAAIKKFPEVIANKRKAHKAKAKIIAAFMPMDRELLEQDDRKKTLVTSKRTMKPKSDSRPIHPWRRCPYGQHWVKDYPKNVEPSKQHPDGITIVHAHCAWNPSHKDELYPEEIKEITGHFKNLENGPNPAS